MKLAGKVANSESFITCFWVIKTGILYSSFSYSSHDFCRVIKYIVVHEFARVLFVPSILITTGHPSELKPEENKINSGYRENTSARVCMLQQLTTHRLTDLTISTSSLFLKPHHHLLLQLLSQAVAAAPLPLT
jgi:hypothetical protein